MNLSHIHFSLKQLCLLRKDKCLGKDSMKTTMECLTVAAMFVSLMDQVTTLNRHIMDPPIVVTWNRLECHVLITKRHPCINAFYLNNYERNCFSAWQNFYANSCDFTYLCMLVLYYAPEVPQVIPCSLYDPESVLFFTVNV